MINSLEIDFEKSFETTDGPMSSKREINEWIDGQRGSQRQNVVQLPIEKVHKWGFDRATGDFYHESGKFFRITALEWNQEKMPIIDQPEIGILGLLSTVIDGVFHVLIQAKIEPGNVNGVQLSPTVQATKSNYSLAHGGNVPQFVEYFTNSHCRGDVSVISDNFQSEQGRRYFRKRNRNAILLTAAPREIPPEFAWFTLGQLREAFLIPNLINSCLRSVLSTLPVHSWKTGLDSVSFLSERTLLSMFRYHKEQAPDPPRVIGFGGLAEWELNNGVLTSKRSDGIKIIGVEVDAGSREVAKWSQPLVRENSEGEYGAVITNVKGIPCWVLRFAWEPGLYDLVELGPTWIIRDKTEGSIPSFWYERIQGNPGSRKVLDRVYSEEGGRFYQSQFRHVVYWVPPQVAQSLPEKHVLVSDHQLRGLVAHAHYIGIELRSLLSMAIKDWWYE